MSAMSGIVLTTINARYVHASLGLRYLAANLGELRDETQIVEFVLGARPADMVEQALAIAEEPLLSGDLLGCAFQEKSGEDVGGRKVRLDAHAAPRPR